MKIDKLVLFLVMVLEGAKVEGAILNATTLGDSENANHLSLLFRDAYLKHANMAVFLLPMV